MNKNIDWKRTLIKSSPALIAAFFWALISLNMFILVKNSFSEGQEIFLSMALILVLLIMYTLMKIIPHSVTCYSEEDECGTGS